MQSHKNKPAEGHNFLLFMLWLTCGECHKMPVERGKYLLSGNPKVTETREILPAAAK